MKTKILRAVQLFWAYFIGLGAVTGMLMMLIDPSGRMWQMESLLPMLRESFPFAEVLFSNFIPSAFALFCANGLTNFVSAALIHRHSRYDIFSAIASGVILMMWIAVEFYVWGFSALSVAYLIFALLQLGNALLWKFSRNR